MRDLADAAACLSRARVHFGRGSVAKCRGQIEAGLAVAGGTSTEVELRLLIERARIGIYDWDPIAAVAAGVEASSLARVLGVGVTESELALAHALLISGSPASIARFRVARRAAKRKGEVELEFEAGNALSAALYAFGSPRRAIRIADLVAHRASAAGRRVVEAYALYVAARVRLFALGEFDRVPELIVLLEHAGIGVQRPQVEADIAVALADAGRPEEGQRYVELSSRHVETPWAHGVAAWARAEVELTAGRPARALAAADAALAQQLVGYAKEEISCVRRWALYDLGRPERELGQDLGDVFTRTMRAESHAFAALADGDPGRAHDLFMRAAALWHDLQPRSELRALRAAGLAAAALDARTAAVELLRGAEERAAAQGFAAFAVRLHCDLESLGNRRVVHDCRHRQLSPREREVLSLVAQGFPTAAIAEHTGLACATVESHVRGAMAKLGAKTRVQAARLVHAADEASDASVLTEQEAALLVLLARGESIAAAARLLAISRRTAARRLAQARATLGVATTAEAVSAASLDR